MGLFEHWPYVNFHDMNLDWIIKKIKNIETSEANSQASAEAAAESAAASKLSADAALASQEAAHQSELNAAQSEENAAASAEDASDTVSNTLSQISLLQARVDNIIPDGTQTEGNTELLDIRVAYDGVTYDSAGNAVRGQASKLAGYIDDFTYNDYGTNRFNKNDIESGYLGSDGNIIASANWYTSNLCYVGDCETVFCSATASGYALSMPFLCTYDENKQFIEQISGMPSSPYTVPEGVSYIRFCFGTSTDIDTIQLENGSSFTSYHAYHDPIKKLIVDETLTQHGIPADAFSVGVRLTDQNTDTLTYEEVSLTLQYGKLLNAGTGAISDHSNEAYAVSDYVQVTPGSKISVTARHFYEWGLYAFYDVNHQFISGEKSAAGGTVTAIANKIVNVPLNAEYVVIGNLMDPNTDSVYPYLLKGILTSDKPSDRWSGKKWCVMGDSLTDINSKTRIHYFDYIAQRTGINIVNFGRSGSGYANHAGGANAFYEVAQTVPADTDVITIFGSFNDLATSLPIGTYTDTGTSTLAGCMNTTIDNLYAINPLANIGIIAPTAWDAYQPSDSGTAYQYVEVMKKICEHRAIRFLDLWRDSGMHPWDASFRAAAYSKDSGAGTHPDEAGHKIIATKVQAFLDSMLLH